METVCHSDYQVFLHAFVLHLSYSLKCLDAMTLTISTAFNILKEHVQAFASQHSSRQIL